MADMLKCHLQTHVAESPDKAAASPEHYPDQVDEMDVLSEMGMLTDGRSWPTACLPVGSSDGR